MFEAPPPRKAPWNRDPHCLSPPPKRKVITIVINAPSKLDAPRGGGVACNPSRRRSALAMFASGASGLEDTKLNANENRNHPVKPQDGRSLWGMGCGGIDHSGQIAVAVLRGGLVGL